MEEHSRTVEEAAAEANSKCSRPDTPLARDPHLPLFTSIFKTARPRQRQKLDACHKAHEARRKLNETMDFRVLARAEAATKTKGRSETDDAAEAK